MTRNDLLREFLFNNSVSISPSLISHWWFNPSNKNSLRLTNNAFDTLNALSIKAHEFKLVVLPSTLLSLERKMTCPYYIHNSKILCVYGESEAMLLHLHGGDVVAYLRHLGGER